MVQQLFFILTIIRKMYKILLNYGIEQSIKRGDNK